jgi:hypothetical protein
VNLNDDSPDEGRLPAFLVAAISFWLAAGSSLVASVFVAGLIDAGPFSGEIVRWGVASGCVLAVLVSWLAVAVRMPLAGALALSPAVGLSVFIAFGVAHEVPGYLYEIIGPVSLPLGVASGPVSLAAVACIAVGAWKVGRTRRIPHALRGAILALGATTLLTLAVAAGRSLQVRITAFRLLREQADEAAQGLQRLGLITEWRPPYGLKVKGTPTGGGIDPARIAQVISIVLNVPDVKLNFTGTELGNDALPALAAVRHLVELDLTDTQVTDAGLASLKAFPELGSIELGGCRITDAGLIHLTEVSTLTGIFLSTSSKNRQRVQVTDEGVLQLKRLRGLQMLQVPRTVSERAMRELRSELPGLAVYYGY